MKWCASDCSILIYLVSYQNQIDNHNHSSERNPRSSFSKNLNLLWGRLKPSLADARTPHGLTSCGRRLWDASGDLPSMKSSRRLKSCFLCLYLIHPSISAVIYFLHASKCPCKQTVDLQSHRWLIYIVSCGWRFALRLVYWPTEITSWVCQVNSDLPIWQPSTAHTETKETFNLCFFDQILQWKAIGRSQTLDQIFLPCFCEIRSVQIIYVHVHTFSESLILHQQILTFSLFEQSQRTLSVCCQTSFNQFGFFGTWDWVLQSVRAFHGPFSDL